MLGGINIQNGGPLGQSHEYVGLHLGLSVCHDKVDGLHVPPKEQGKYKDAMDGCPGSNRSKRRPVSVSIYLSMAYRARAGLPPYDFTCQVTLATKHPHHWYGFCILWHLRLADDASMLQFGVLFELLLHGPNELVTVWLS